MTPFLTTANLLYDPLRVTEMNRVQGVIEAAKIDKQPIWEEADTWGFQLKVDPSY